MLRARGHSLLSASATPVHARYAYTTLQRSTGPHPPSNGSGSVTARSSCAVRLLHSTPRRLGWADALVRSVRRLMGIGKADNEAATATHEQQQQQQQSTQQPSTDRSAPSTAQPAGQTHQSAAATNPPDTVSPTAVDASAFIQSRHELGHGDSGNNAATDVTLGTHSASQAAALVDLGSGAVIEEGEGDAASDAVADDADADAEVAEAEAALARHDTLEERSGADDNPVERVLHEEAEAQAEREGREDEIEIEDELDEDAADEEAGVEGEEDRDFAQPSATDSAAATAAAAAAAAAAMVPPDTATHPAGRSGSTRGRTPSRPLSPPRPGVKFTSWRTHAPAVVRLHQQRMYSAAIAQFNLLWSGAPAAQRTRVPQSVLESYLSALSSLHAWDSILKWHRSAPHQARVRAYSSPLGLDLLLQACMRHPRGAPLAQVWAGLHRLDRERTRRRWMEVGELRRRAREEQEQEQGLDGSSAAAAVAAATSAPVQLVLSEKAANQLMKAALLANQPDLALDIWGCVVMGARPRCPALAAEEALHRSAVLASSYASASASSSASASAPGAGAPALSAAAAGGSPSPKAVAAALAPMYKARNYRLHSQTAWGLVNYLLQRRVYSAGQAPPSPMMQLHSHGDEASPSTSSSSPSHSPAATAASASARPLRPSEQSDPHADLFRAFQVYLQTSFIEQLHDQALLGRILNTTLCAVLRPPAHAHAHAAGGSGTGTGPPVQVERGAAARQRQRNTWLALQIYKFVLHHNESIGRVDAAHAHAHAHATTPGGVTRGHTEPGSTNGGASASGIGSGGGAGAGAGSKDTPWSYRGHRRYIQLDWGLHYRPLLQVCLLQLEHDRDAPASAPAVAASPAAAGAATATSSVPNAGAGSGSGVGVGTTGGAPASAPSFDAALWLDALLYDVRMSFPDYTSLLSGAAAAGAGVSTRARVGPRERAEVEQLELEEALQNEELALYTSSLSTGGCGSGSPGSAASAAPWPQPLPARTLLPNMALRPLDQEVFLAIAREWLRRDRRLRMQPQLPSQLGQTQEGQPPLARLVSLYQSVPHLSRYDSLRTQLVELALSHLCEVEGGAVALSRATAPLLSEAKRLATEWRSPEAVARREARAKFGPASTRAGKGDAWSEELDAAAAEEAAAEAESEDAARERWVAEHASLHALSTSELFDPSTASALLESMDVHANLCAAHTSSALSFLLRIFGSAQIGSALTCLHLFDLERWRVSPTAADYAVVLGVMATATNLDQATQIVRALHRTLMLAPGSYRSLPTMIAMFDAYAALTGVPESWQRMSLPEPNANASSNPAAAAPVPRRYRLGRSCAPHVVDDVADSLAKLFAYVRRVHIQPLLSNKQKPGATAAIPASLPLLLRYLQAYICWLSQHGLLRPSSGGAAGAASAAPTPEATYARLAEAFPSVTGVSHLVRCPPATDTGAGTAQQQQQGEERPPLRLQDLPTFAMLVMRPAGWALLPAEQRDVWVALMRPASADAAESAAEGTISSAKDAAMDAATATATAPKRQLTLAESAAASASAARLQAAEGFTDSVRASAYAARRSAAALAREESARSKRAKGPLALQASAAAASAKKGGASATTSVADILARIERSLPPVEESPPPSAEVELAAAATAATAAAPKPSKSAKSKSAKAAAAAAKPQEDAAAVEPAAATKPRSLPAQAGPTRAAGAADADATVQADVVADAAPASASAVRIKRKALSSAAGAAAAKAAVAGDAPAPAPTDAVDAAVSASSPSSSSSSSSSPASGLARFVRCVTDHAHGLRLLDSSSNTDLLAEVRGVRMTFPFQQLSSLLDQQQRQGAEVAAVEAGRAALRALHRLADEMERRHDNADARRPVQQRSDRMAVKCVDQRNEMVRWLSQAPSHQNQNQDQAQARPREKTQGATGEAAVPERAAAAAAVVMATPTALPSRVASSAAAAAVVMATPTALPSRVASSASARAASASAASSSAASVGASPASAPASLRPAPDVSKCSAAARLLYARVQRASRHGDWLGLGLALAHLSVPPGQGLSAADRALRAYCAFVCTERVSRLTPAQLETIEATVSKQAAAAEEAAAEATAAKVVKAAKNGSDRNGAIKPKQTQAPKQQQKQSESEPAPAAVANDADVDADAAVKAASKAVEAEAEDSVANPPVPLQADAAPSSSSSSSSSSVVETDDIVPDTVSGAQSASTGDAAPGADVAPSSPADAAAAAGASASSVPQRSGALLELQEQLQKDLRQSMRRLQKWSGGTKSADVILLSRRVRLIFEPLADSPLLDAATRTKIAALLSAAQQAEAQHSSSKALDSAERVWNHNELKTKSLARREKLLEELRLAATKPEDESAAPATAAAAPVPEAPDSAEADATADATPEATVTATATVASSSSPVPSSSSSSSLNFSLPLVICPPSAAAATVTAAAPSGSARSAPASVAAALESDLYPGVESESSPFELELQKNLRSWSLRLHDVAAAKQSADVILLSRRVRLIFEPLADSPLLDAATRTKIAALLSAAQQAEAQHSSSKALNSAQRAWENDSLDEKCAAERGKLAARLRLEAHSSRRARTLAAAKSRMATVAKGSSSSGGSARAKRNKASKPSGNGGGARAPADSGAANAAAAASVDPASLTAHLSSLYSSALQLCGERRFSEVPQLHSRMLDAIRAVSSSGASTSLRAHRPLPPDAQKYVERMDRLFTRACGEINNTKPNKHKAPPSSSTSIADE